VDWRRLRSHSEPRCEVSTDDSGAYLDIDHGERDRRRAGNALAHLLAMSTRERRTALHVVSLVDRKPPAPGAATGGSHQQFCAWPDLPPLPAAPPTASQHSYDHFARTLQLGRCPALQISGAVNQFLLRPLLELPSFSRNRLARRSDRAGVAAESEMTSAAHCGSTHVLVGPSAGCGLVSAMASAGPAYAES